MEAEECLREIMQRGHKLQLSAQDTTAACLCLFAGALVVTAFQASLVYQTTGLPFGIFPLEDGTYMISDHDDSKVIRYEPSTGQVCGH